MISTYFGRDFSVDYLRDLCHITRSGVSLLGISEAGKAIGLNTLAIKLSYEELGAAVPLPCILHWRQNHFVVLVKVRTRRSNWLNKLLHREEEVVIADPGYGLISLSKEQFFRNWINTADQTGVALVFEPTEQFYAVEEPEPVQPLTKQAGLSFLFDYIKPYKKYLLQLFIGMVLGSLLNLAFPILTQKLVDRGITHQDMGFVYLILLSQLVLFVGSTVIEVVRSWLLLHINTRINITIISDFLIKLMRLPIRFFDTKLMADITQRIDDHDRIEHFLTSSSLSTVFSMLNFVVFAVILGGYSPLIFSLFLIGSFFSVGWILLFLERRKHIDYNRFDLLSEHRNSIYEIITGMQEIKLNNCETPRRWEWEQIQSRVFALNVRSLSLEQYQQIGTSFFNQLKNIVISFIAAREVMDGQLSLGVMLSISYIIGQMNSPISQLIEFFHSAQDAKISLERLGEIHNKSDEEKANEIIPAMPQWENRDKLSLLQPFARQPFSIDTRYDALTINNVSFQYDGPRSPYVLKDLNVTIPFGKVTAIVGSSGSGKTTLMKLLLKFYEPQQGHIHMNGIDFATVSAQWWRSQCGVVMQDGYIFSDTIANNITLSGSAAIDEEKLWQAARIANILEYVQSLPLGFNTKIGGAGAGLSIGQQQRLLIARAVYRDPQVLFFDEATSALDANNERVIMENLNKFFEGKTVMVIAHRLSTVKNADQIIVLDDGRTVEIGTHLALSRQKGYYYNLVKNQLELGN
jgi:ATP-binding cassette subfamily B protein